MIPLRAADAGLFGWLFWRLRRSKFEEGVWEDGAFLRPDDAPPPPPEAMRTMAENLGPPNRVALPHHTGGDARGPLRLRTRVTGQLLARLPVRDRPGAFADAAEARRFVADTFPYLEPCPWPDVEADAALTRLVTHGLGAHLLRRVETGFEVDLLALGDLACRPGYERYGARLDLDAHLRPVAIQRGGVIQRPGDPNWSRFKHAFQATLALRATVVDHSLGCHFTYGGLLGLVARLALPPDHALRRLLMPFGYGTVRINCAAMLTLLGPGRLFERLFALPWEELCALQAATLPEIGFETFPERVARLGLSEHIGSLPFVADALAWWDVLDRFVADALDRFGDPGTIGRLDRTWGELAAHAPVRASDPHDAVRRRLTVTLFHATVMHRHVGHLGSYVADPAWLPVKIGVGSVEAWTLSRQDTSYKILVALLVSRQRMPRMLDDLSHLWTDPALDVAWTRFQTDVRGLGDELAARTARRDLAVHALDPATMELSVSL